MNSEYITVNGDTVISVVTVTSVIRCVPSVHRYIIELSGRSWQSLAVSG